MEKQYFYSSNSFMPQQMEMCKPILPNKYSDCLYPMQPMMPQPQYMPTSQFDLYKTFNIPMQQPMYKSPLMAPVSMDNMFFMQQQPEYRKVEEEVKQPPLIPIKPIKLPEVKPQPVPVPVIPQPQPMMPKPQPLPQELPKMMISFKKTHAEIMPQPQPMVCPVEQCIPCMPCMLPNPCIPCQPCLLPKPFMPCMPQPIGFDCFPDQMSGINPFMGQPCGMYPFIEE